MVTSSLPAGPADKGGANYEILWGLHAMLDVVLERADSIRIEPPGVDGAEFYLLRQGVREHWQTKRQVTAQENWSLQKLKRKASSISSFRAPRRVSARSSLAWVGRRIHHA